MMNRSDQSGAWPIAFRSELGREGLKSKDFSTCKLMWLLLDGVQIGLDGKSFGSLGSFTKSMESPN